MRAPLLLHQRGFLHHPDYDGVFWKYLEIVQEETDLMPIDHDVYVFYSVFWTPRKMLTT